MVYFMQELLEQGKRDLSTEFHSAYNKGQWGPTAKEQGEEGFVDKKLLKENSTDKEFSG